jgi:RNA polymerase sigma-70 factor (ECF subfamily)
VLLETMVRPVPQRASQLEQVFADEQRSTVLTAMDDLSENHREILVLRYYDDLSYAEIAEVLGVKLGTVMSRLSRARQRLSDVMGEAPAA